MDPVGLVVGLLLGVVVGVAVGVVLTAALLRRSRRPPPSGASGASPSMAQPSAGSTAPSPAPFGRATAELVDALPIAVAVLDGDDTVVLSNGAAVELGLLRGPQLLLAQLRSLARDTRLASRPHEAEVPLSPLARGPGAARVRMAPLAGGHVLVLVEDVSEARRVEAVRRDFVVNVSHELKTPVGALGLLAEALGDAADDPAAVRRFAGRVRAESDRLSRLVQEIVELSRLQGADPLPEREVVPVDQIVAEALDRTRTLAAAASIDLVRGGHRGLRVRGSESQLVTALTNLLANAVHYSPAGTRVAVGVRLRDGVVEVTVTDQGIGIAADELDRVFERFYRSDPARSRATGGTGLGLAIVKHIATNHGGDVTVWSVEGSGSTFTLRLPAAVGVLEEEPVEDSA